MAERKNTNPLELRRLQQRGMSEFGNLNYRIDLASQLAKSYQAKQIVLFDDIAYAVPEDQRQHLHGVPGYERALLPGLMLATGFEMGATILVSAPPNPVEMGYIKRERELLEQEIGRHIPYRVIMPFDGRLIELTSVEEGPYEKMCLDYATKIGQEFSEPGISFLVDSFVSHSEQLVGNNETLVIPFQTTPIHHEKISHSPVSDHIVLPDMPEMDKAYNNLLLKDNGFDSLPMMVVVRADGQEIYDFDQYREAKKSNLNLDASPKNLNRYANGVINAIERLHESGLNAYVKIDSNGVSGLGNLDPGVYPEIYNHDIPLEERVNVLLNIFSRLGMRRIPEFAVVEEYVKTKKVEGVSQDYTVCGQLIDGVFLPTSINPFATSHGVYDREWVAPQAEVLGENPQDWTNLFDAFAQMGGILTEHSNYRNGILAGDAFIDEQNRILVHDFNFRRGGRSTPEAIMALKPEGWFEGQIEINLGLSGLSKEQLFMNYTSVCRKLFEMGIYPFSTAFGYFGKGEHGDFMKFKLMAPMTLFSDKQIQRSQQLENLKQLVESLVPIT